MATADTRYARLSSLLLVLAVSFSILPDGFDFHIVQSQVDAVGGNILRRLQWMPLFALAGYIIWRRRNWALRYTRDINPFLLLFVGYAILSMAWSPHPDVTLRKDVLLVGLVLIGMSVHLAAWYPSRLIDLLRLSVGLMLLASVFAVIFVPSIGITQGGTHDGYWRGVRETKNLLASLAAIGVLIGAHALMVKRGRALHNWAYLLFSLFVLIMSRGKTPLISVMLAIPFIWVIARAPIRNRHWLVFTLLSATLVVAIPLHFYILLYGVPSYIDIAGPVFELFGKDPTLTSRDYIWEVMWTHIEHHWIFGYGYGAFWLGSVGPSGEIIDDLYWVVWQAHNGYIDLLNEVGIVGCSLVAGFLIYHLVQLRRVARVDRSGMAFHLALLVVILVSNLAETSLFSGVTFYNLLMIFSSLALSRRLSAINVEPARSSGHSTQAEGFMHVPYSR